jgi:glycosyltransferase involved in cell wall biosynthesis
VVAKRSNGECKNGQGAGEGAHEENVKIMKISVITVCWNSAKTIETTFSSVLNQRYPEVEYLVIDGGSSDGTVERIKKWEPLFNGRMRWISERDEGMYDAINKGIRMATGDIVGILNADDFLSDDQVLARVVQAFANPIDVLYGDIRFITSEATDPNLAQVQAARTARYYSAKNWKPWMLQWGYMPPHPSVYLRRELFAQLGSYKQGYHIAADYELLIRYLRKAKLRLHYLPCCMVGMRMGGKSTKNWRSNLLLNQEIVRGNREAGYFCCLPMLLPKYVFKVWEFVLPRLLRPRSGRNGECKNGGGKGEGARLECDRELARGEPVDVPGGPRSGRNGECKNGGGKGEGARGIL